MQEETPSNLSVTELDIQQYTLNSKELLIESHERAKFSYIISTFKKAQQIVTSVCPELPTNYPLKFLLKVDPGGGKPNGHHLQKAGIHYLLLTSTEEYSGDDFGTQQVQTPFANKEIQVSRSVSDLYTMFHELGGHASYDIFTNPEHWPYGRDYYDTIDSAVSEGFAVATEIELASRAIIHPTLLSEAEKQEMLKLKQLRLDSPLISIDEDTNSYSEGHSLIQAVLQTDGYDGVVAFIRQLDGTMTRGVSRAVQHYRETLLKSPGDFLTTFKKSG
jgi:hypothetical protein